MVHAVIYLSCATAGLFRGRARLRTIVSGYPNSAFYWLLFMVVGLLVLLVVDLVMMGIAYGQREFLPRAIMFVTLAISLYMLCIAIFHLYRPEVFFLRPVPAENLPEPLHEAAPVEPNKAWRELDQGLATELSHHLARLLEQEQIYREHELSLQSLAERLGVTPHQASELLNVHLGTSFYDYLNGYRLRYAAALLADRQCQLRVLDIAFEAGFSNKNSFYRYFKQAHGLTPVEYRQRALGQHLDATG